MTDCARCGDCCDPVRLSPGTLEQVFTDKHGVAKPGSQREWIRRHLRLRQVRADGTGEFDCAFFDRSSRQCQAYDQRPQMCQGYPFYGSAPSADTTMGGRCSYLADVPGITMLPIVAVSSGAKGDRRAS